jgi:hypothetical protein
VHVQRGYRLSRFRQEGTDMDMHRDILDKALEWLNAKISPLYPTISVLKTSN